MAIWIHCDNCNKKYRADSTEMNDVGVFWSPELFMNCKYCQEPITIKLPKNTALEQVDVNPIDKEGITTFRAGNIADRATEGNIYEKFVQEYFSKNYHKYGFTKIKGPFPRGPDFTGFHPKYKNEVKIEIECKHQSYINHGHDRSKSFHGDIFLVVLESKPPSKIIKKRLPNNIIHIDINHFSEWWLTSTDSNRFNSIVILICTELEKIYYRNCSDTDRSMAICPNCNCCSYFDSTINFKSMAVRFIASKGFNVLDKSFTLNEINSKELESFYSMEILSCVNI